MGVDVRLNCEVTSCGQVGTDPADLLMDAAASPTGIRTKAALSDGSTIVADRVLVATGRKPNLPEISDVSIEKDEQGHLQLDTDLRAQGTDWLYVVGDASSRAHTTHEGKYQARMIGDLIVSRAKGTAGQRGAGAD